MEPTYQEAKAAVDALNTAFAEFKTANDQRLRQIEAKGVSDPLIQQKLDKINADIEKHGAIVDAFAALEAKVNKLAFSGGAGDEAKAVEAETKAFNGMLRAKARQDGREFRGDLTVDEFKTYKAATVKYLRYGPDNLSPDEKRAMSVGSDPDGGVMVTPDMSGRVVRKLFETSPIRQIAAQQTISTDALEGLRDTDEASASWVAETGARSETNTPTLAKWRIPVHEQYAMPAATQTLLDDANINVEQWLADKVADKFARVSNTAFVTGSGVGRPRGFADYGTAATVDASRTWGTLEHVATGTSGGYGTAPNGSDKLIDLVHKLNANYRQGARWVMNRRTLGTTRQLKANSEYIWLPSMTAGQPSSLLGYPITEADDVADIAANSLSVWFGNYELGYQIVDRIGIRTLRDPYTNKPYVRFYTTMRVGGDVVHFDAIKVLKFSTS